MNVKLCISALLWKSDIFAPIFQVRQVFSSTNAKRRWREAKYMPFHPGVSPLLFIRDYAILFSNAGAHEF